MYIRVHSRDNVGILVHPEGAAAGALFPEGLVARERIPQSHKIALRDLAAGEGVLRYGQTIGVANRAIQAGSWVREEMLDMPAAPPLDELPLATAVPAPLPPLEGYTFEGYRNADGTGTKNILGLATTVQCVAPTVEYAAQRIRAEILPRFPNVDGVVAITHSYGCGVAIEAPGAAVPIQTLRHIGLHANLAGQPLLVSLGCEKLQPSRLFEGGAAGDFPILGEGNVIRLQDERGFGESVAAIMRAAEKRLAELDRRRRRTVPASELVVGLQCGGSDAFSGITANPALGVASDLLVRAGATTIITEITEFFGAEHLFAARAVNRHVAADIFRAMARFKNYVDRAGGSMADNPSPGNKEGGLLNITIKSLGALAKSGRAPVQGVLDYGVDVFSKNAPGLWLLYCSSYDQESVPAQVAAGCQIVCFTTGRGTGIGNAIAPVLKIGSNTPLYKRMAGDIDVSAGTILDGNQTVEEAGQQLFDRILAVASGQTVKAEENGHREFMIWNEEGVSL